MKDFLFIVAGCLLVLSGAPAQGVALPEIHRRVTDLTGTLSDGERRQLESILEHFEQATSNQIAVLMISSLGEESLEDYSLRVAEKNGFGKKGRNNGILLLIAKEDRKIRIEVGYGLEGALPDATSDQIIRHEIVPKFRQGDFFEGISAGLNSVIAATRGEYQGEGRPREKPFNLFPLVLIILMFGVFGRMFFGRRHYIGRRGYSSSWPWFGGFGGGGSGGGFGGGGFSGGGGSFGGGGASGSW